MVGHSSAGAGGNGVSAQPTTENKNGHRPVPVPAGGFLTGRLAARQRLTAPEAAQILRLQRCRR